MTFPALDPKGSRRPERNQGAAESSVSVGGTGTIPRDPYVREAPLGAVSTFRTGDIRHSTETSAQNTSSGAGDRFLGNVAAPGADLRLHRAVHLPDSYWAVVGRQFYTGTLDTARRDDQDRALYVVKLDGREFATVRTVPQVRNTILARINAESPR